MHYYLLRVEDRYVELKIAVLLLLLVRKRQLLSLFIVYRSETESINTQRIGFQGCLRTNPKN